MEIKFYGAKQEVGRSMIKVNNIFLDCGIKISDPVEVPEYDNIVSNKIENIIITHAHLDHCGYLPHIIENIKNIHVTKPTRDLMQLLLSDYQRIQKIKNFGTEQVSQVMQKTIMHEYNETYNINDDQKEYQITMYKAGHILGSSMIKIETQKENSNEKESVLYTGDMSLRGTKILEGAEQNIKVNDLIIETTYSGENDQLPSLKNASKELCDIAKQTIENGGYLIIPTFAVGRGQNILLVLADHIRSGALPNVPIYVDGMIKKANKIYRSNIIHAKKELQMRILTSMEDPFINPIFKSPRKKDRSDVLSKPCIIVTTSGMLTGGPIMTYLKYFIEDEKSTLCLVGYQVEGTRGRKLLDGEKKITIDEKEYEVKMNIKQVQFSAHSDRNDLVQFIQKINSNQKLDNVYLVHGEKEKMINFKKYLEKKFDFNVIIP